MKALKRLFEELADGKNASNVFTEILDYTIGTMLWDCDPGIKLQNMEDIKSSRKLGVYINFLQELGNLMANYEDPLGDLFMEYISKGLNGQYFTPMNICKLMTTITIGEGITSKTVSDPTCGSGRMLLAAASMNRKLFFHGSDIDLTCCKMATINLLLNSLSGRIFWGNPLTNKYEYVFVTGVSSLKLPYVQILKGEQRFQEKKYSISLRRGEQLTLF